MPRWRNVGRNLLWRLVQILSTIYYTWNILFMARCVSAEFTVEYRILDNITEGTAIGNMETDTGLSKKYTRQELSIISFIFLRSTLHTEYWHYFKLSPETGVLTTARNVDRDKICPQMSQCDIQLAIAIQPVQYFEKISVLIIFDDYNDNPPKFSKNVIKLTVTETVSPGLLLQVPPATDPDSPENGIKGYTLICDNELFQLVIANSTASSTDPATTDNVGFWPSVEPDNEIKIFLLQSLDREYKAMHELVLIAHDQGKLRALEGSLTIIVKVDDVNDNSPKFLDPSMTTKVLENAQRGSLVIYMSAFDPDDGANGKVVYSFSNETLRRYSDLFKINPKQGRITLKAKLDYEKESRYSLEVIAQDMGSGSFPATAKVIVEVIDVNDNSPDIVVQPQYADHKLVVVENALSGARIAFISASDRDSSQNGIVSCQMDKNSYEVFELLQLYEGEYKLVTRVQLDREEKDNYDVTISCVDMGNPPRQTDVTFNVIVLDENDHIPKFERDIYECALLENTPNQTNLLQVKANEPDSGINGIITYKLDKDAGRAFVINESTGVIDVVTAFNRETVGDIIEFHVLAVDTAIVPQTSTATVKVSILDVDDNAPKFIKPKYIFHIYENTPGKTALGHVSASDNDNFPYNRFTYMVSIDSKSNTSDFHVDPESGKVWAKKMFDREKHQWHFVNIIARSNDPPYYQDKTLVQVYIKDRNDNYPNITFPSINNDKAYVSSLQTIGSYVETVKAFDIDEGPNGRLNYYFPQAKVKKIPFIINEKTGNITVSGNLSHYVFEAFPVELVVKDRGQVPLAKKAIVNIIVTNKISQQNTWDRERMSRDRGMSMAVRIVILVMVVVVCVATIIGASMFIRVWVIHKKKMKGSSNFPSVHMNSNGYIPGSMKYVSDTGEDEYTDTDEEQWNVQQDKRTTSESVQDLKQSFDTQNLQSEDSYEKKSSHQSSTLSPSTSYSTETLQSGIIRKERRRSLPQAPSTETDQVITNWKANYGSIDRNIRAKGQDRYSHSNGRKTVNDLYRNYSMDSNGVIYRNKNIQPNVQKTVDKTNPKYQAYPDLVLHQYKKRIVEFTEGSKKLPAKPYEDLWNKIHLKKDRLKHSIPGHCTILDRNETSNDDSVSGSSGNNPQKAISEAQKRNSEEIGSVPRRDVGYNKPVVKYNTYVENKWMNRNGRDLSKPVIRVEPPTPTPTHCDRENLQRRLAKVPLPTNQTHARAIGKPLNRSSSFNDHHFVPPSRQNRTHYKSEINIAKDLPSPCDPHVKPTRVAMNGQYHTKNFNKTSPHLNSGRRPPVGLMNGQPSSGLYRTVTRNREHSTNTLNGYKPKVVSPKQKQYSSMIELDAADSDGSYI